MTARCAPESTIYDMPAAPDGITRYDLIAMAASDARLGRVLGNPPAETTQYDLRTLPDCTAWPEQAKAQLAALRVEVERLALRVDNAVDAVEVTALRVNRLEEIVAVQRAAIERLADALTVIQLREGL